MSPPSSDEQDAQDMARLARGEDLTLNAIMDRHAARVYQYLLRSLQNEEDAADLAQETFARVYQHRDRFNSGQKFTTWLYAIAANLVRDRFRWRARHPQVSLEVESAEGSALNEKLQAPGDSPTEVIQERERAHAVQSAVAKLPQELREPLILSVYEGLSHAEIGEILKCSPKAVETRLYRARGQLRKTLDQLQRP